MLSFRTFVIGISVLAFFLPGCTNTPTPSPTVAPTATPDLPLGWRRVQVREGYVGRAFDNPLAGFTIDLPPGWDAGESWPGPQGLAGWIAAPPAQQGAPRPMMMFHVGEELGSRVESWTQDSRHKVTYPLVRGQYTILHLAADDAIDQGPQVGIFYPRIPGGPPDTQTPSIRIEGDSRGFVDQTLLARVLTSARYAEIKALPALPVAAATPQPDWRRAAAHPTSGPTFTVLLPPGWRATGGRTDDSIVGHLSGDSITIHYDFGGPAGVPLGPSSYIREQYGQPPHRMWEERVGNNLFWLAQSVSPEPDARAVTAGYAFLGTPGSYGRQVALVAYGLNRSQQERVLAILRTIEIESR